MFNKYAVLLDDFGPHQQTKIIADEILRKPQYDCTIFVISKENIISNPFAVFSIADYFNFDGITIVTSQSTLEKANKYPAGGPRIIIGQDVQEFNLDQIQQLVTAGHKLC